MMWVDLWWSLFVQLGISSDRVMTDKKSSSILIYQNKDTGIHTEDNGVYLKNGKKMSDGFWEIKMTDCF